MADGMDVPDSAAVDHAARRCRNKLDTRLLRPACAGLTFTLMAGGEVAGKVLDCFAGDGPVALGTSDSTLQSRIISKYHFWS